MARGWESKSVEAQMESAGDRRRQSQPQSTPDQLDRERKRDSLLLQRKRIQQEISRCTDARYRKTLGNGLEYLEAQLKALGWRG